MVLVKIKKEIYSHSIRVYKLNYYNLLVRVNNEQEAKKRKKYKREKNNDKIKISIH